MLFVNLNRSLTGQLVPHCKLTQPKIAFTTASTDSRSTATVLPYTMAKFRAKDMSARLHRSVAETISKEGSHSQKGPALGNTDSLFTHHCY